MTPHLSAFAATGYLRACIDATDCQKTGMQASDAIDEIETLLASMSAEDVDAATTASEAESLRATMDAACRELVAYQQQAEREETLIGVDVAVALARVIGQLADASGRSSS